MVITRISDGPEVQIRLVQTLGEIARVPHSTVQSLSFPSTSASAVSDLSRSGLSESGRLPRTGADRKDAVTSRCNKITRSD